VGKSVELISHTPEQDAEYWRDRRAQMDEAQRRQAKEAFDFAIGAILGLAAASVGAIAP
jgi:hypothetical protein